MPAALQIFETVIRHPSDLIQWIEASGMLYSEPRPLGAEIASDDLQLSLSEAPSDLTLVPKRSALLLWRSRADADTPSAKVVSGNAEPDDLLRPNMQNYALKGLISDRYQRLNPRQFSLTNLGGFVDISDPNASGRLVELYRSPLGTRFGSLGGLEGRIQWQDGSPASWAILSCEVGLLHIPGSRTFKAQADRHGDFSLAFSSLPFPKKERHNRPRPPYSCSLSMLAEPGASGVEWPQPDNFSTVQIQELESNPFHSSISFEFQAGIRQRLTSAGSDDFLVIRPGS